MIGLAIARTMPPITEPVRWSDNKVARLGQLIGDGSYLKQHCRCATRPESTTTMRLR